MWLLSVLKKQYGWQYAYVANKEPRNRFWQSGDTAGVDLGEVCSAAVAKDSLLHE